MFAIGYSNKKIKEMFNSLIIVKSCNIEYKKSANLEDQLTVRSFVKKVTKTSFFMNQIISREDEIIVEAQVHLVFVNENGKPVKIPDKIYLHFKPYFAIVLKSSNFFALRNKLQIIFSNNFGINISWARVITSN